MKPDLYCETPSSGIVRLRPVSDSTFVEIHWMNAANELERCVAKQWLINEGWIEAAHRMSGGD